jgi:protein-tyrosine-phosphatase
MRPLPGALLFACSYNQVRSPMAKALMTRLFGGRLFIESCGLRRPQAADPDPFMVQVMDEIGIDLSKHRQKIFADLEDGSFDLVISLTPEAQHGAVELTRNASTELLYWPTRDPTLVEGRRDAVLDAYRRTRDELEAQIRGHFGAPSTFGG